MRWNYIIKKSLLLVVYGIGVSLGGRQFYLHPHQDFFQVHRMLAMHDLYHHLTPPSLPFFHYHLQVSVEGNVLNWL